MRIVTILCVGGPAACQMADTPLVPFRFAIFDLFGTLVPEFPSEEFYGCVRHAARVLGADEHAYLAAWTATAIERQTGRFPGGLPDNVRAICRDIGRPEPPDALIAEALVPREEMYRRWFYPREGALETVGALRERGVPLGLISMCAPDTPALWRASAFAGLFDVEVFSSEVGLRKPDPAIYRYALDRLDADAAFTLYCGDGSYGELTGAEAVGMTAVEIRDPVIDRDATLHFEGEDWRGAHIADLRELIPRFDP